MSQATKYRRRPFGLQLPERVLRKRHLDLGDCDWVDSVRFAKMIQNTCTKEPEVRRVVVEDDRGDFIELVAESHRKRLLAAGGKGVWGSTCGSTLPIYKQRNRGGRLHDTAHLQGNNWGGRLLNSAHPRTDVCSIRFLLDILKGA